MASEKKVEQRGITVRKADDMPEWYSQVVTKTGVADYAPVRGCMIIRPLGYGFWQRIMDYFNERLAEMEVKNAYFPLFIPESFFTKEAEHAEGFSPEVAWIERKDESQERLALRPTSETIMYDAYGRWIRSHRDLPLRMNQWCNIVRWEVQDTKIFLRSREFLWQEGHCVYETEKECVGEVLKVLDEYEALCHDLLAVPVLKGRKTEQEKFAGAVETYSIEAFMPDGKALQMGTSHHLGQNFAKAFGIGFIGKDEKEHLGWQNSWGVSTRLLGALIMVHSDDKGLVIPPRMAQRKVVIVPIYFKDKDAIIAEAKRLAGELKGLDAYVDDREEYTPGWKFNDAELLGIPLRIELGPRDLEKRQCVVVRRDTGEKTFLPLEGLKGRIDALLEQMQKDMYEKARAAMDACIVEVKDWKAFLDAAGKKRLIKTSFCGEPDCEQAIKEETKGVTSRNIPLKEEKLIAGKCVHCTRPAKYNVFFSRAY